MVESMVALVLVDHLMMQYAQCDLLGQDDYTARPMHAPSPHTPPCRAVSHSMPVFDAR